MIADDFNKVEKGKFIASLDYTGSIQASPPMQNSIYIPGIGPFSFEELNEFVKGKQAISHMLDIQGSPGNWNTSEYMRGLYNGLVLAGIEFGLTTTDDLKKWE